MSLKKKMHLKLKEGAYHAQKGIAKDKKIPVSTMEKDSHSSDETTRKRAQFALNARKWNHAKS
jgi:oligoendopeptidase F